MARFDCIRLYYSLLKKYGKVCGFHWGCVLLISKVKNKCYIVIFIWVTPWAFKRDSWRLYWRKDDLDDIEICPVTMLFTNFQIE